jgi:putative oxidoreductase
MAAFGAGVVETTAGAMLVTGFLTPLAAAAIIGMMLNAAISVNRSKGFIGGYELDAVFGVIALAIAFTGAGRYSIDTASGWGLAGTAWGLAAAGIGLAIGGLVLASRTPAVAAPSADIAPEERRVA